ncbi:TetR/AcrR family transcriptional regulator [Kineosporia sp. J2-2]|uniref:TetR/AcrR family transcriptional regulator n=1 Tax=Kineosporia corallincola TaxID=2835133 RepID=A0ABS5TLQ2_9ACTN|nr:TetR/AcrR family transcriptional regulator [Kineosporia corallincola]MBT0771101.1 TetR/AcrR family transcriptional regulator [Kineosporia corallincola]
MDVRDQDDVWQGSDEVTAPSERPLRADARRNRERLLRSAVLAFSRDGTDASLEGIAKDAGVGIGTLYRHFPSRDELVEAAYRNELARLCDAAGELLVAHPADQALRRWMDHFIDYMTTKREMADALTAVIASGRNPYSTSRARMTAAVDDLLGAGVRADLLRGDVQPVDVLLTLSGIAMTAGQPDQREQAGRMLDLLVDGLRFRPS